MLKILRKKASHFKMPPREAIAEVIGISDGKATLQNDVLEFSMEFLQCMRQQMTDLVARNEDTNAKLELLSMHYQSMHRP